MIRLQVAEGPNVHVFARSLHSFYSWWKFKQIRAIYVPLMCKSDHLVIRIAGSAIIGVYSFSLCKGIIKSKPVTGYECRIVQTF